MTLRDLGSHTPVNEYDRTFFDRVERNALRSGSVVAEKVIELFHPATVVDVGCGTGAWLRVFSDRGVSRILGVDGDWVPRDRLLIPPEQYVAIDLSRSMPVLNGHDLALSLEVAEHLPNAMAGSLVGCLTAAAPIVLFSAAVPGQGGTHHINLQWPWYWRDLFQTRGFVCADVLRPLLWYDDRVDWVYRQNMFVFLSKDVVANYPSVSRFLYRSGGSGGPAVVFEAILRGHASLDAQPVSALMGAVAKKVVRRVKRMALRSKAK